jgi:hypothetical protein
MTKIYLRTTHEVAMGNVTATHSTVYSWWEGWKIRATNCTWVTIFHHHDYLKTQSTKIERKCLQILAQTLEIEKGAVVSKMCDNLIAMCWKDKREVYMLANTYLSPAQCIFDTSVWECHKTLYLPATYE